MQKRVISIITGCGNTDSCRILLKKLTVLLLMSQYVLSLFMLQLTREISFFINSEIHDVNTGHSSNLHLPWANLGIYQKGV
jgi:hypothetical protein